MWVPVIEMREQSHHIRNDLKAMLVLKCSLQLLSWRPYISRRNLQMLRSLHPSLFQQFS